METKGYYAAVGFFVIVLSAVGIVIGLWLSVGLNRQDQTNYTIYINESVAGLSVSAPVKYNGVDVGTVKKISIDPTDPNQVVVVIAIDSNMVVNTTTRATLNIQGVTGIAYIELDGTDLNAPPLKVQPGQLYPIIASRPSLLFRMDTAINSLAENLKKVTGNIDLVFNKKNGQLLQDTLENMNTASHRLNGAIAITQSTFQQGNVTLQTINNQMLPQLMTLLDNVNGVTLRLDDFTQQLSNNPAMLIRGQVPAPLGPGETGNTTKARN
jgi:phospholipid/cholesterol/gamma-HCH transport system substrate-binding protein